MVTINQKTGDVKINGRKIAKLRYGGALCDIRRHGSGFLYSPVMRVAVVEELLETLTDTVLLQFKNIDSGDVWTCTVRDFRHWAEPVQFAGFEPQRAAELSRMNHTISGSNKSRRNELLYVDVTPVPVYTQTSFFG